MKTKRPLPYLLLIAALLLLLSNPPLVSESLRGTVMSALSPFFKTLSRLKSPSQPTINDEIQRLELENKLLYAELIQLRDLVDNNGSLKISHQAVPARVIFRSPNTWYSSFWINLGSEDNENKEMPLIARNSPVLIGTSIIGVIDYVGDRQSRVRLITDSGLSPSVRVLRKEHNQVFYLAKGELRGASDPLWRSNGQTLQGIGFNYDFADEKGPARDLRSGEAVKDRNQFPSKQLIQAKDLLVTTGMDGVFPPDLQVATVTKIYPLKEGDYYYEIEAEPTAGKFDDLSLVFVLPPWGYNSTDQPK